MNQKGQTIEHIRQVASTAMRSLMGRDSNVDPKVNKKKSKDLKKPG